MGVRQPGQQEEEEFNRCLITSPAGCPVPRTEDREELGCGLGNAWVGHLVTLLISDVGTPPQGGDQAPPTHRNNSCGSPAGHSVHARAVSGSLPSTVHAPQHRPPAQTRETSGETAMAHRGALYLLLVCMSPGRTESHVPPGRRVSTASAHAGSCQERKGMQVCVCMHACLCVCVSFRDAAVSVKGNRSPGKLGSASWQGGTGEQGMVLGRQGSRCVMWAGAGSKREGSTAFRAGAEEAGSGHWDPVGV